MATGRRLPSGSFRVRVFSHTDSSGKKIYKSFTAPTKKQAEMMAAQYQNDPSVKKAMDLTVSDAIDRYITAKTGVLSPSSIRGYRQMQGKYYEPIAGTDIYRITTEDLQKYVSSISGSVSAKTVSNVYGLLSSALTMFRPDATFRVTLPKRVKPKKKSPSNEQVQDLFRAAEEDIKICIALAAFGSLRRGEICALKYGDISGDIIHVHADMIENEHNKFEYKEIPKTSDSVRFVRLPAAVVSLIGTGKPDEFIVLRTPNAVTHAFTRLRDRLDLDICFHDLRHYFASIGVVLGVPDTYMSDFGGWRQGSGVMKEVYQNVIAGERDRYQQKMVDHFESMTRNMTRN